VRERSERERSEGGKGVREGKETERVTEGKGRRIRVR
jgi:hypothetical protein